MTDTSSPTGVGSRRLVFEVLWNLEFGMSRRIKPKEKYVRISMKEIWRYLDGPSKNKEFVELGLCSDFELSRPKVAQIGHSMC